MPSHIMTKRSANPNVPFFSTEFGHRQLIPWTCTQYFNGHPGAFQNEDVPFELEVEKLSDTQLRVVFNMNG